MCGLFDEIECLEPLNCVNLRTEASVVEAWFEQLINSQKNFSPLVFF